MKYNIDKGNSKKITSVKTDVRDYCQLFAI